jgi:hypothetical protein
MSDDSPLKDFDVSVFKNLDTSWVSTPEFDSQSTHVRFLTGVGVEGILKMARSMGEEVSADDAQAYIKHEQAMLDRNARRDAEEIEIPEPVNYETTQRVANKIWNDHLDEVREHERKNRKF